MDLNERILHSRILIIDDQPLIGDTLKDILQDEGFKNIRYLADSRKAAEVYQDYRPDLLVLDINMPHCDGFQVMETLKPLEKDSYLPVLVLTGETEFEVRLRALRMGAKDFLQKPFNTIETISRIRNLIEVRLLHNDVRNQNILLEEKVKERSRQLYQAFSDLGKAHLEVKTAYIDTIYHLTRASEFKDEDTSTHIQRISHYSSALAKALGLDENKSELLFYSSPMHDIGKIGIPDRILMKNDSLTPEEWEIMKKHTEIGAQILGGSNAPILQTGEIIALTHHECWDGSGYPRGLKGNQIPLEGRIVILVDVYDALRSKRSYKPALDHKTACDLLLKGDGKRVRPEMFDPAILEIFKKMHSEFERIFEKHSD